METKAQNRFLRANREQKKNNQKEEEKGGGKAWAMKRRLVGENWSKSYPNTIDSKLSIIICGHASMPPASSSPTAARML